MSGLITARELVAMQATAAGMLPDSCTIQTRSTVANGQGGVTETWASTINVPCKLSALLLRNEGSPGDRYAMRTGWMLSVAYSTTIAAGNRAIVNGHTYEVTSVEDEQSYRVLRRAYMQRVD